MKPQGAAPKAPHVVMLVDNGVIGDSRVQKEAASMQALGWRVTLVGRRMKAKDPARRVIGGVVTRFVDMPVEAGVAPQLERFTKVRSPLAYATLRKQRASSAVADAAVVDALWTITSAKASGRDNGLRRIASRAKMARAQVRKKFVSARVEASISLREKRRLSAGWVDRAAIRWWQLTKRGNAWQRLDPVLWDWELAYGPVIDRLKPDLIHANDHRMLSVGSRAVARAKANGRDVKLVWDAHEWLPGLEVTRASARWLPAQVALERQFVQYADAVVTVSDKLASMLQEHHGLAEKPAIVCNAPFTATQREPQKTLREVIGIDEEVPLLVYSGAISPERSVDTVIRALPSLPDIHFVLVVRIPFQPVVPELLALAEELGVRDRVHTAPFVTVEEIVPYLSGADAGVHTILHGPNNEIALATKFYEYAQARLPILVTDVKVMSETARRTGQGEVFRAGDVEDLVRAARLLFSDLPRYRKAFDDTELMRSWTWEAQAEVLDGVYRRTLGLPTNSAPTMHD